MTTRDSATNIVTSWEEVPAQDVDVVFFVARPEGATSSRIEVEIEGVGALENTVASC